ncbi:intradiol ring-cleavage dioxygenase [cf. Phormidesmis sp. LEGE 11477]|uniref:dioxygenase family protein n=1 Tax=cf. Phormidesmis sp. LEGE 11477 TaxID=1828680 RepID=UPI00187F0809|nr:intradiol ring-cleavage dioxygenase [cf. Phormidesmis sp. LEGE 11477]MBE9060464.1 intradiol ring-cleavage dioxygenase [cf. Phormidesmis sp. LEGE 11477]
MITDSTKRIWAGRTSRRRFLRRSPYFFAACGFAACSQATKPTVKGQTQPQASSARLSPTPACEGHTLTPSQTAGPFYTPNSPQRQSLLSSETVGTRLTLTGKVLSTDCTPLDNSLVDVWQADAQGTYDNEGNKLRGHQFTDNEGRYRIETIVPGLYPGRTRHLHIKVQAPNYSILTTQLYLPNEPLNERDFLFQSALLMVVQDTPDGKQAQFDFVLS